MREREREREREIETGNYVCVYIKMICNPGLSIPEDGMWMGIGNSASEARTQAAVYRNRRG